MAQALIGFLKQQYVERDGHEQQFFAGVWGIFGTAMSRASGRRSIKSAISVTT
jgi:3D-(3,5/4)-trihydroxycyclohexane-1,2-dione acylhydrolase (decyclizing)